MADQLAGADGSTPAAPDASDDPVDQKAAFRAALEKKNAAAHARGNHLEGDNHIAGSSHAAASKRMFRRKSGS
jgi:Family of unknown function (DUF5302)